MFVHCLTEFFRSCEFGAVVGSDNVIEVADIVFVVVDVVIGSISMSLACILEWFGFVEDTIRCCGNNVPLTVGISISFEKHVDYIDRWRSSFEWKYKYVL